MGFGPIGPRNGVNNDEFMPFIILGTNARDGDLLFSPWRRRVGARTNSCSATQDRGNVPLASGALVRPEKMRVIPSIREAKYKTQLPDYQKVEARGVEALSEKVRVLIISE